jgi:predicted MPP superfamily phosphohydrolase
LHNTTHTVGLGLALSTAASLCNAAFLRAVFGKNRSRRTLYIWLTLTFLTTISVSTGAADLLGLFSWLPGVNWFRAAGFLWAFLEPFLAAAIWMQRNKTEVNAGRRAFLSAAAAATVAAPVATAVAGFSIAKRDARVSEVTIPFPGLPQGLHGLRLVQITDIHMSPFYSRRQFARAVDQANELKAHIALVTGDLITSSGDPLDDAILEVSRLRSDAGIYGCLGNHEILADAEEYTEAQGAHFGIYFLRQNAAPLRFGDARINLAGVDYQTRGLPYLVGTGSLVKNHEFNLLLSHNPDVFPVAARQGWDLTIAGHTHGGQVTLEYLHPGLNPARFYTPYTNGLYNRDGRQIYVCRGLGTVGLPLRLGAEPEIGLIRLVPA